ncbi:MAG TPA: YhdH/YhfP family quinone oxidoreductase [Thermodesulfobacteriota bacterium]|nr:YhdH/YhfP family quinone oxidoreductase [Thermodesulfobacteriota bacterium]
MATNFKALVVSKNEDDKYIREIKERSTDDLPDGGVLVKVNYSSLNYKDALSAIGSKGVTRNYPHTPGVDSSGVVEQSSSDGIKAGDKVIVHAYDLGVNTSGGFGQYIRVPADWVVKLPNNLSQREAMIFGTAGFTAAQCIYKMEKNGVTPSDGEILVTGATGGVGSTAVAILSKIGYDVVASTGKTDQAEFLKDIGAKEVISREDSVDLSRPLLKGRWAGVVDTVGGDILATAIHSTKQHGTVTCCGNVGGHQLNTNVYPFILRGVDLLGVDSQNYPMEGRVTIWNKMANTWKTSNLEKLCNEISLEELNENIDLILEGKQKGRVVVNLWK